MIGDVDYLYSTYLVILRGRWYFDIVYWFRWVVACWSLVGRKKTLKDEIDQLAVGYGISSDRSACSLHHSIVTTRSLALSEN